MNDIDTRLHELQERLKKKNGNNPFHAKKPPAKKPRVAKACTHLNKLVKVKNKLPVLPPEVLATVNTLVNFDTNVIDNVIEHLKYSIKEKSFTNLLSTKDKINLNVGERVKIISGNPKYIGKIATLDEVRKIRCFVKLPEAKGRVYLLISDVEKLS